MVGDLLKSRRAVLSPLIRGVQRALRALGRLSVTRKGTLVDVW